MSRKTLFGISAVGVVLALIAYFIWCFPRQSDGQGVGLLRITKRTVGGQVEFHSQWAPLSSYHAVPGEYVEWVVSVAADPSKPEFTITFRRGPPEHRSWEEEVKQPAALIVDGRRLELKPNREVLIREKRAWALFNCEGKRSDLAELAAAKSAEIEFGGQRYDLGEQGLAICRGLFRRTEQEIPPRR